MGPTTSPETAFSGLSAIGQIAITVADVDRAVAYCRETPSPGWASSTKVPDINQAHAALAARGVEFERPPHLTARMPDRDLWMAFFRDPDGNLPALMCEAPRA
jgi:hypothetical protein